MATSISIPDPCHESWANMAPVRSDCRHCAVCDRQIIDFTQKTDREILAFLQKEGRLCGRFRNDQLNRPLQLQSIKGRGSWSAWAAGFLAFFATQTISAQIRPLPEQYMAPGTNPSPLPENSTEKDSMRLVSGKIVDEVRRPLTHAIVAVTNTSISTRIDSNGCFLLSIPMQALHPYMSLSIALPYRSPEDIPLPERIRNEDICLPEIIYSPLEVEITTGMTVLLQPETPTRKSSGLKRFFRRLTH